MKKIYSFLLSVFLLLIGSLNVWGDVTVWTENWSGTTTEQTPPTCTISGYSSITYAYTNGGSNTRTLSKSSFTNPELLIGKSTGKFTVTIPSSLISSLNSTLTLNYSSNQTLTLSVTNGTLGTLSSSGTSYSFPITVTNHSKDLVIEFANKNKSNARFSNITLTGTLATVAITSIAFPEPKTASVGVGGNITLTPTILPANHTETIDWESDATSVATVNNTGEVTGIAAGTAHITAKSHDNPSTIYDVCTITVTAPIAVSGISLNKTSTTLLLGRSETLEATIVPADATNKNISWESSNDTKVSVEDGVITALALTNGSPVTITATSEDGEFEATCSVTVEPVPVSGVSLNKTSATLVVDKTLTLEATISPNDATDQTITWESDNDDVTTVSSAGVVTAIAVGSATITAKSNADNTKIATCAITVTDGAIDLTTTGEISFGDSFSSAELGSGGYKTQDCDLNGSDGNIYTWKEADGYYNSEGWQIKKSTGTVTSPIIKSNYGFTISTTKKTNDVTISDGTNSGTNTLTTTKTNTTITITGDGAYAVFTKITITPTKAPIATGVSITDPGTLSINATGTFAASSIDASECTKVWSSSNSDVIEITDATSGTYIATGRGSATITYTITPEDGTTYRTISAACNVNVTAPVVITASDIAMTYGDAATSIGATTSSEYSGSLSYLSGNTSIATIDANGEITAMAIGSTTITISAPADNENLYTAGENKVINVTIGAPMGESNSKPTSPTSIVNRTLLSTSFPSGWTGDGNIWSGNSTYGAITANGTIGNSYDLETETIDLDGNYTAANVTFQHTGNNTFSTTGTGRADACKLFVTDGVTETQLIINTMFAGNNWTYVSNTTDLTSFIGKKIKLIFRYTPSTGNQGKWEIKNFVVSATPSNTENVTLNADGYATFCSQYPLDFSEAEGYTAWYVTGANTSTNVVTFSKITGSIKGGQGILLKGTPNATISIKSADSENVLSGNKLVGCLAPTYINNNANYYALVHVSSPSHSEFQDLSSYQGIVPAGKAYLDLTGVSLAPGALRIVFEENNATDLHSMDASDEAIKFFENGQLFIKKNGVIYDVLGRVIR